MSTVFFTLAGLSVFVAVFLQFGGSAKYTLESLTVNAQRAQGWAMIAAVLVAMAWMVR